MKRMLLVGITALALGSSAMAQVDAREDMAILAGGAAAEKHEQKLEYSHPTLPAADTAWPGAMLIIIAGMFLAAMVIGPVVRVNTPEEVPEHDAHGHDDHGHGAHGHH